MVMLYRCRGVAVRRGTSVLAQELDHGSVCLLRTERNVQWRLSR